jgi:class 3 adenylate cyclase/tetratricopeptide (TPR) repeat protein
MLCASCGHENRESAKFCAKCGSGLGLVCPSCSSPYQAGDRFCAECGAELAAQISAGGDPLPAVPREAPAAERRLVCVLFADLVGFTPLSESRDAEETRELLSRYFDTSRTLIERYGGTVEKFIGDAVMAVWGTPVATEDDAERAVRAALELTEAVAALGEELSAPELQARIGVLTGEAAVTIGAEGQGMVAGDLVNTASRIQAAAAPGQVYVGDSTRRLTEQTIVYEDAGAHELKGKTGLVPLWRALRVVSGARGSLKSSGLEAPFAGRTRELRLIKELFHATAAENRAHLFSITGIAGIGKSRLAWEFYKYFDGLVETTYWHRGRCLAYGEGVTYWALADMVRMRARIAEDEETASALAKLRVILDEHIADTEERRFVEPRLAHLLGLQEHEARDKQDLFAAWRIFFERLSETYPTVLVFEDLQWAESSLLDFIEYLLEWSRDHPLYVVTHARPELVDRRPLWGAGRRNFTSLYLEPLSTDAMEELLSGLVPGLPQELRAQILERAEGIPLYAVETVRMLLDRGLLVQEGSVYRPVGPIETLEVPQTLHALIAARLDGLTPQERRLLQDGAILGKTFTRHALAALGGRPEEELEPLLASLTRKEVLSVQADPRSPEHGQYGFLQDLVKRVAYETLSKRERRSRHLDAADYLAKAFADDDEIVEVLASHYLDAYEAAPDADDAADVRAKACATLARAGERASSLAASGEAQRYFEQAARLAEEASEKAGLLSQAGQMAWRNGEVEPAERLFVEATELYDQAGDTHAAARVSGRLAEVEAGSGRLDRAVERMEQALEVISGDEPDEDLADLAARVGAHHWFAGRTELAAERTELALDLAESLWLPDILARTLHTKALIATTRGHIEETIALLNHALKISLEHDLHEKAGSAYFTLSDTCFRRDRYRDAAEYLEEALALARKTGDRLREWEVLSETTYPLYMTGRWAESMAAYQQIPEEQIASAGVLLGPLTSILEIHIHRGSIEQARHLFSLYGRLEASADVQDQACYSGAGAALRRAEGDLPGVIEVGRNAVAKAEFLTYGNQAVKQGFVEAVEASLVLGDRGTAEELLGLVAALPPGQRPPYLEAQAKRFEARLQGSNESAAPLFGRAGALLRELAMPFWLAVTLLEHGEWLRDVGEADEADVLITEAREIFERLEATPWLERVARRAPAAREAETVPGRST